MRFLLVTLISIFFISPSFADRPERGEQGERGRHAPSCDHGQVNECVARNQAVGNERRTQARRSGARLEVLRTQTEDLAVVKARYENKRVENTAETNALNAEIEFANRAASENAAAPLEEFPSLEDFFRLHPLQKNWSDRFPTERAQKLTERVREAETERAVMERALEKITGDFASLNSELQSVTDEHNNLLAQISQHDHMCERGCQASICPPFAD